jgi:hypothetical protein
VARFDISILGRKDLEEALRSFPERLERKVLAQALKKSAQAFATLVQHNVPVSDDPQDRHPGWWKSTMGIRTQKRKRGRVGVNITPGTREELALYGARGFARIGQHVAAFRVYDRAKRGKYFYPAHAEFGHKIAGSAQRVPAKKYMGNVLRAGRAGLLAIIRQEIDRGLEQEYTKTLKRP